MVRSERTHLVDLLVDLKAQQVINPAPELASAIRKIRRRVLGLYTAVLNKRKPVDNPTVALTGAIIVEASTP